MSSWFNFRYELRTSLYAVEYVLSSVKCALAYVVTSHGRARVERPSLSLSLCVPAFIWPPSFSLSLSLFTRNSRCVYCSLSDNNSGRDWEYVRVGSRGRAAPGRGRLTRRITSSLLLHSGTAEMFPINAFENG